MNILLDEANKDVVHFFARPKKWTKERAYVEIGRRMLGRSVRSIGCDNRDNGSAYAEKAIVSLR